MPIHFKVNPRHCSDKDEEYFVNRIARIVCNNPTPFTKEHGYKWNLDTSNDWWMDRVGKNEYILDYRYFRDQRQMDELRRTIIWLLSIKDFNQK